MESSLPKPDLSNVEHTVRRASGTPVKPDLTAEERQGYRDQHLSR